MNVGLVLRRKKELVDGIGLAGSPSEAWGESREAAAWRGSHVAGEQRDDAMRTLYIGLSEILLLKLGHT